MPIHTHTYIYVCSSYLDLSFSFHFTSHIIIIIMYTPFRREYILSIIYLWDLSVGLTSLFTSTTIFWTLVIASFYYYLFHLWVLYYGLCFTTTLMITLQVSKPQNISNHLQIHDLRGYMYLEHSSDFSQIVEVGRSYIMKTWIIYFWHHWLRDMRRKPILPIFLIAAISVCYILRVVVLNK
jgi:hypothetical protein